VDTLYVADDSSGAAGGIFKYSLDNGVWTLHGHIGTGSDAYRGLTGTVSGTTVTLYATGNGGSGATGGGKLVTLTDSTGHDGTLAATPTTLATASANEAFRGVAFAPQATASATPWINEFHYDNAGTDTGEFIEIAGAAGTNLSGYSLVLYNGADGASYTTTPLSGVIANQQNGFGTISFSYPTNGIQNGSPDGIALVGPDNTVIQFLSYEGAFTAVGGPANGMTSTDVGVSEPGDVNGQSLQLAGTGTRYSDFTWHTEQAQTAGAVNTGQNF